MSLSGNLGFVSLGEVLRLLTRSQRWGSLVVEGEGIRGRVFFTKGGIALATISDDEDLHRHLLRSGHVDDVSLRSELLREITVESIHQMSQHGDTFEVHQDQDSPLAGPEPFQVEALLSDAEQRGSDWREVSKVVSDLEATISFNRDPGGGEDFKIDRDSWSLLSQVGSGSSVHEMAEALGTTRFWAARVTAGLIEQGLVSLNGRVAGDHDGDDKSGREAGATETFDPKEEPEDESAAALASDLIRAVDEMDSDDDYIEEDTEVFLERVFSQLESPGDGLGPHRRRGTPDVA